MRLLSTRSLRFATLLSALAVLSLLPSCGGSGGTGEGGAQTMQFGPLTTRVAGTVQPPVTSAGYGAAATGVAGGNITTMTLQDTTPTLAETRIAFASYREGSNKIFLMNADGSGQTRLTNNAAGDDSPSWSADGTKIAFVSNRDGNNEIYSMTADGSGVTRLTTNAAADSYPSWSPDGTKIAFESIRDGNWEIYVMNADGSGQTRLTSNASSDVYPSWSPAGSKIAFASFRDGNYEIYVMNTSGGVQSRLTYDAAQDTTPAWSPDGSTIAFASRRDGNQEIYTMNADGSMETRLTNNAESDTRPFWSPDGTRIAFTSQRDGNQEIYTMNADGSSQTRVTRNTTTDDSASWSPFVARRTLVGVGGSMGTNAAGFLFGQTPDMSSIVVFDAVTRTSARVKAQTAVNLAGPALIFTLSADNINRLAFVNFSDTNTIVTLIGPSAAVTTATDAIVSFDSTSGDVASILPYTANRSAAPTFTDEKGARVVRGRFLGAWDGKGVNRAPNGASEVRLDAKTGEIVGVK